MMIVNTFTSTIIVMAICTEQPDPSLKRLAITAQIASLVVAMISSSM